MTDWSLEQLIETVEDLDDRGVGFRTLTEAVDTSSPGVCRCFRYLELLRPPALSAKDLKVAKAMMADPDITMDQVADQLGVAVSTLYRHLPGGGR